VPWLEWLEAEFKWSDETARRFIQVFELSRDAKFHTCVELDLPLRVLYQLAAPKAEHARQEIADRIEAGEEVTRETVEEAIVRIRQKGREIEEAMGRAAVPGAIAPVSLPKPRSRKSRFDAEHYAFVIGEHVCRLNDLQDDYPERFDAILDHILSDRTVVDALAELVRHPKIGALTGSAAPDAYTEYLCNPALSEFFSQAGGGDIYNWLPADRRDEVCCAFLDRLTVAGMCKVMSDEFGRQLRDRLPAPKRNEQHDIGPYSPGEHDRLRARVEELNNEKRALEIKIVGLQGEVEQLKQQLSQGASSDADLDVRNYRNGILARGQQ
jgi:hypothetical protein